MKANPTGPTPTPADLASPATPGAVCPRRPTIRPWKALLMGLVVGRLAHTAKPPKAAARSAHVRCLNGRVSLHELHSLHVLHVPSSSRQPPASHPHPKQQGPISKPEIFPQRPTVRIGIGVLRSPRLLCQLMARELRSQSRCRNRMRREGTASTRAGAPRPRRRTPRRPRSQASSAKRSAPAAACSSKMPAPSQCVPQAPER